MAVPRSTRTAVSCSPLYDPLKVIGSPTHTLTHTGKGSGGQVGQSSIPASSFLDQKGPESLIHQRFDLPGAVGKDEVPGPNPGSSSKTTACFIKTSGCLFDIRQFDRESIGGAFQIQPNPLFITYIQDNFQDTRSRCPIRTPGACYIFHFLRLPGDHPIVIRCKFVCDRRVADRQRDFSEFPVPADLRIGLT